MKEKEIKTPAYWREERFQPLIEVETIYGNKVEIPRRFKDSWDMMMDMSERIISKQGRADGLRTIEEIMKTEPPMPGRERVDFCKVFIENYRESH